MSDEDNILLLKVMPNTLKSSDLFLNIAKAINKDLKNLNAHDNDPYIYDLDELSSGALDHLAKQWGTYSWRDSWPKKVKADVLRSIIPSKQKAGTLQAIKESVKPLGSSVTIREWWQKTPQGKPHTFEIYIDQGELDGVVTDELLDDLKTTINLVKPVRSQYIFIVIHKFETKVVLNYGTHNNTCLNLENDYKKRALFSTNLFLNYGANTTTFANFEIKKEIPNKAQHEITISLNHGAKNITSLNLENKFNNRVAFEKEIFSNYASQNITFANFIGKKEHKDKTNYECSVHFNRGVTTSAFLDLQSNVNTNINFKKTLTTSFASKNITLLTANTSSLTNKENNTIKLKAKIVKNQGYNLISLHHF